MSAATCAPAARRRRLYLANRPLAMWAMRRTLRSRPDIERRVLSRMQLEDAEQVAAMALCAAACAGTTGGARSAAWSRAVEYALAAEGQRRTVATVSLSGLGGEHSRPFQPPDPRPPDPRKQADDAAEVASLLSLLPRRWRPSWRCATAWMGTSPRRSKKLACASA